MGKLCNKAVEKPGWCGKPDMPVKNWINGNDKGVWKMEGTSRRRKRSEIFEKWWTTEALKNEKRSAGENKENKSNKTGEKCRLWKTDGKESKSWKTCGKSGGQPVKTRLFSLISGVSVGKFLKESRGNFFQKVSFGASPLWHFLFASFSFVPTCSKEKEEL